MNLSLNVFVTLKSGKGNFGTFLYQKPNFYLQRTNITILGTDNFIGNYTNTICLNSLMTNVTMLDCNITLKQSKFYDWDGGADTKVGNVTALAQEGFNVTINKVNFIFDLNCPVEFNTLGHRMTNFTFNNS